MALNLKLFFSLIIIGLLIDYVWIGVIANNFYLSQYGDLARLKADGKFDIVMWSAILVYILISIGLVAFVLPKVGVSDSYIVSLAWGFIFGIILYGVFDFTNYATIAKWPIMMCVVDVLWGGVLCALVTSIGKYLRDSVF